MLADSRIRIRIHTSDEGGPKSCGSGSGTLIQSAEIFELSSIRDSFSLCLTFAQVIWDAELCPPLLLLQYPGRIVILVAHGDPNEGRGGQSAHLAPVLRPHLHRSSGGHGKKIREI